MIRRWTIPGLLVLLIAPVPARALQWDEPDRCPAGTRLHLDKEYSYSYCVPEGWTARTRGLETVWEPQPGRQFVASVQTKTLNGKEAAQPLVSYLGKKGAKIHQSTSGAVKYFLGRSGGVAWVKHQYRFAVLMYTMCGDKTPCDSLIMKGVDIAGSLLVGGLSGTVPYDRWKSIERGPLRLLAPSHTPAHADLEWLAGEYAAAYNAILKQLGVEMPKAPLRCFFYPSEESIYRYTRRRNGFHIGPAGEVHSLFAARNDRQSTGHELTHAVTWQAWGEPHQALMGEGIAVALDQSGIDYHKRARNALNAHEPGLSLAAMLGNDWYKHDMELSYAVSGSFVKFLLDNGSVDKVRKLYQAKDFGAELRKQYGWTVEQAHAAWKNGSFFLDGP